MQGADDDDDDFCYPSTRRPFAEDDPSSTALVGQVDPTVLTENTLAWTGLVKRKCRETVSCGLPHQDRTLVVGMNDHVACALRGHDECELWKKKYFSFLRSLEEDAFRMHMNGHMKLVRSVEECDQLEKDLRAIMSTYEMFKKTCTEIIDKLKKMRDKLPEKRAAHQVMQDQPRKEPTEVTEAKTAAKTASLPGDEDPKALGSRSAAAVAAKSHLYTILVCPMPTNMVIPKGKHKLRAKWREVHSFTVSAESVPVVALSEQYGSVALIERPVEYHGTDRVRIRYLDCCTSSMPHPSPPKSCSVYLPSEAAGRLLVDYTSPSGVALALGNWVRSPSGAEMIIIDRFITSIRAYGDGGNTLFVGTHLGEVYAIDAETKTVGGIYTTPIASPVFDSIWLREECIILMQSIMSVTVASEALGRLEVASLRPVACAADKDVMVMYTRDGFAQVRAHGITGVVQRFDRIERNPHVALPTQPDYRGVRISSERLAMLEPDGRIRAYYLLPQGEEEEEDEDDGEETKEA